MNDLSTLTPEAIEAMQPLDLSQLIMSTRQRVEAGDTVTDTELRNAARCIQAVRTKRTGKKKADKEPVKAFDLSEF